MSDEYVKGTTDHTTPAVMTGEDEEQAVNNKIDDLDDEIIMDHKAPLCTKRRMGLLTWGSLATAVICLCVIIPIIAVNSNKASKAAMMAADANAYMGNVWSPLGNSLINELNANTEYGESVGMSGDGLRVAVGANEAESMKGQVTVEKFEGSFWKTVGKGPILGEEEGSNFGHVVRLSQDGNILIASGFGTDTVRGSVRSFKYNANTNDWNQFGGDVKGEDFDRFGVALSISSRGDSFIVGADGANNENPRNGKAQAYKLDSQGNWRKRGQEFEGEDSRMGYAVAMSGDGETICIGERDYKLEVSGNQRGKTTCYYWQDDEWIPKLGAMRGSNNGGNFGYSLSLNYDGSRVAVGNRRGGEFRQGTVTVFEAKPGKWEEMGKEMPSGNGNDQGGFQVALNRAGNVLAWTARGYDGRGADTKDVGIVYVQQWRNGQWQDLGEGISGAQAKDFFGENIALNDRGDIFAASSNWNDDREYVLVFKVS